MKLKLSAFKEVRTPINVKGEQPAASGRFVAELEVESAVGPDKRASFANTKVVASSLDEMALRITTFLAGKNDGGDFERKTTFRLGESKEKKITFPEDGLMVERSMLDPEETARITRAIDAAIYQVG